MTFLNDDWMDWLDEKKVKTILERICYLYNKRYAHKLEYYPAWIREVPFSEEDGSKKLGNERFDILGHASAYIGLRERNIKNFRIHYPDYEGIDAQGVSGFKMFFGEYPNAGLDQNFGFFLSKDGDIIVFCSINLNMGLTEEGKAGCFLRCGIDIFLDQYERLFELTSKQGGGGKVWSDWRITFEKYVENCEYVEFGRKWGKGYEIITTDDEIPF
jgi:hypothetical protein